MDEPFGRLIRFDSQLQAAMFSSRTSSRPEIPMRAGSRPRTRLPTPTSASVGRILSPERRFSRIPRAEMNQDDSSNVRGIVSSG